MFNFRSNNLEHFEDVRDFALNLVKKTRPYLSDNQRQIIVGDLLTRVQTSANLIYDTEAPFEFGKNNNVIRSRWSSTTTDKDSAVDEPSPRSTPTINEENKTRTENRKRSYRTSKGFSSTPKVQQPPHDVRKRPSMYNRANSANNSFVSDMKSGAPVVKKKRAVVENYDNTEEICDSTISVDEDETRVEEQKVQKIPDVFARLYAARKPTNKNVSCKKNILQQKCNDYKRRGSIGNDSSLKECIGSVQKALDNLKLLAN